MDLSKFKTYDWLKVGGAIVFFIFGFLDWVSVDYKGLDGFGGGASGGNVFDFFWTGTLPWILVLATGVLTFLIAAGVMKAGKLPWTMVFLAATALATLLMLIRLIFNPLEGKDVASEFGIEYGRAIGMWGAAVGAILALVGSVQAFLAGGGKFSDLADPNKLKASFGGGQGGGSTPPPPPPPPPPAG